MTPMFRSSADLFAELNRMQSLLDQVFPATGASIRSAAGGFPVLNVGTTPTAVEVQALAPGLDPAKLEITVDRGLLVIAGERKSELPPKGERASSSVELPGPQPMSTARRMPSSGSCASRSWIGRLRSASKRVYCAASQLFIAGSLAAPLKRRGSGPNSGSPDTRRKEREP